MTKPDPQKQHANREVWLSSALEVLYERGVEGIKVVHLAKRLGLTSGSFYWHFKDVQDLLESILDHWEFNLTDHIIHDARRFEGSPEDRILNVMLQVIREDAAVPDHAISVWAKSDARAHKTYHRTVAKRFAYGKWLFEEAGFPSTEAAVRGRVMVTALMGESSNDLKTMPDWEDIIRAQWRFLMARKLVSTSL